MASVTAFNDMMGQFLVELHKTFPDEKGIKKMLTSFDVLKSTNPRLVVDGFMKGVEARMNSKHSILHLLFMSRTLAIFEKIQENEISDYSIR